MNAGTQTLVNALAETGKSVFTRNEIIETAKSLGFGWGQTKHLVSDETRVGRGVYSIENFVANLEVKMPEKPVAAAAPKIEKGGVRTVTNSSAYFPQKNPLYIKPSNFKDLQTIVKSERFFPVFISGPSGTGKTEMVEQVVASCKRSMIRVQVTEETDRDALLGGLRLINGDTVYQEGPIARAAREGLIVLVDEFDRGTNMLMALQGVLEGKPFELPYSGEIITPAPGFNIIANANTCGRGSETGHYSAARIIDSALIERFNEFVFHDHPTQAVEARILKAVMDNERKAESSAEDLEFIDKLTTWSKVIRDTFKADGVDDEIATRRLIMIVKSYVMFGDRLRAIKGAIGRFDEDTVAAFIDLYTKVDAGVIAPDASSSSNESEQN